MEAQVDSDVAAFQNCCCGRGSMSNQQCPKNDGCQRRPQLLVPAVLPPHVPVVSAWHLVTPAHELQPVLASPRRYAACARVSCSQHTSEIEYVFSTLSNYESKVEPTCTWPAGPSQGRRG